MEEDDIKRTFIAWFILREDSECCSKLKLEQNVLEAVDDEYDSDETVLCIENDESKESSAADKRRIWKALFFPDQVC